MTNITIAFVFIIKYISTYSHQLSLLCLELQKLSYTIYMYIRKQKHFFQSVKFYIYDRQQMLVSLTLELSEFACDVFMCVIFRRMDIYFLFCVIQSEDKSSKDQGFLHAKNRGTDQGQ